MPRRRMMDPDFWKDHYVATLDRDERLFTLGVVNNSDDEGRIEAHPVFLKATVFMYDDDISTTKMKEIRDSCLEKMADWPDNHEYKILKYENAGGEYLFLPNWGDQQRPSHPTKSKLPAPPHEMLPIFSSAPLEKDEKPSGESPPQSSLGQDSIVKSSGVQEDFTKFLDSEKDLTDFLTGTLEKYMPRGPAWMVEVIQKLWTQATGDRMKGGSLEATLTAVKEHPPPVLGVAYAKAVKYKGGKYNTAKYLQKILQEKAEEYGKGKR